MSVERDALRFMEAKLDYGKGSGTRRKLIKAELENKFKDDAYKAAFNDALLNVDTDAIMRRIERRKEMERAVTGVKKTYRTVKTTARYYPKYKDAIRFLLDIFFGGSK